MASTPQPPNMEQFNAARRDNSRVADVHLVGPRKRRPVTNFLKLTFVAGALWAGTRLLSGMAGDLPVEDVAVQDAQQEQQAQTAPDASGAPAHQVKSPSAAPKPGLFDNVRSSAQTLSAITPSPEKLVNLAAINASPTDRHNDIVRKYQATGMKDFTTAFEALSVQAEGIELKPYNAGESKNPSNVTIGVGYHVPSNLRTLGRDRVISEFLQAGIPQAVAEDLVSEDPKRLEKVEITPTQGLSLLAVTMPRYKDDVVARLGQANWKRLGQLAGPEGQAGVVWSAYNGAFWQHANETIAAIRSGDRLEIADSISGTAKIDGKSQENHNLSLARAAVASRDTFNYAVGYGNRGGAHRRVESLMARAAPVPPVDSQPTYVQRAQPDLVASGQMMAVDVQPTEPHSAQPHRTRLDPAAFESSRQAPIPEQAPAQPSPYRR